MTEYVLEIVEGPEVGRRVVLAQQPVEIGREAGAGLQLAGDQLVSRRHARLTPGPQGVVVEDLESSNGTFVDGQQIHTPVVLSPGSELTVGVSVIELHASGGAPGLSAVRPVPAGLTALRERPPIPPPPPAPDAPPGLAVQERSPDYLAPSAARSGGAESPLSPLLDIHTKRMARTAPLAIFVLVVFVVIIALALR